MPSTLTNDDVALKATAARRAAAVWRRTSLAERIEALRGVWAAILARRPEGLAIIREETGRPDAETDLLEFGVAAMLVDYFLDNAERILGTRDVSTPWFLFNKRATIRRVPRGIIGIIAPWNLPFLIPFGDSFCALLTGNAALLKPSEWTPKTALWIESIAAATGLLPDGLLGVVAGGPETGEAVVDVADLMMFTGSTKTGRAVAQRAASRLKPAILELGGKHPMIVCADAPMERAAAAAVWGGLANGGQLCVGVERVFVEAEAHDEFVRLVRGHFEKRNADPGAIPLGRFILPALLDRVQAQLDEARRKGAQVLGGEVIDRAGFRMAPALVLGATADMTIMNEETFGPVVPIMKVSRAEEGVAIANAGPDGLAASVWSANAARAEALSAALETGLVGINEPATHYAYGSLPFGGFKVSGMWRRHGDEGLRALTQSQSIVEHEWPLNAVDPWWFPYESRRAALVKRLLGLR